jgi:hypothetical protein
LAAPKSGDSAERPAEWHRHNARASIILISQTNPWHALGKNVVALSSRFPPSEFGTMKKTILVLLFAGCASLLRAATDDPKLAAPFNAGELDQLLRPIALYPDPFVALILPASTFPADVVLAARFVTANGDPAAIASQPWDTSVQALAHYPAIIKWMDANLEYTRTLGEAFANQPEDVMAAIQRLRAQALATGALTSTAQQVVAEMGDYISIEPAQPSLIYVPAYNWDAVYDMAPNGTVPLIQFGVGWAIGPWLTYECDWGYRRIGVRFGPSRWRHNGEMADYRDWRRGHELDRGGSRGQPDPRGRQMRERAVGQAPAAYDRTGHQAVIVPPAPTSRPDEHANLGHFNAPRENGNPGRATQNNQPPRAYGPRTEPPRSTPARTESPRAAPAHAEPAHSVPARSAPAESGGRGAGSRSERDR